MRLLFDFFFGGSWLWPAVHHNICVSLSLFLSWTSFFISFNSDFLMFHCANNKTGRGFDICLTFVYVNGRRMGKRRWWRSVLMNTEPLTPRRGLLALITSTGEYRALVTGCSPVGLSPPIRHLWNGIGNSWWRRLVLI